ncbi:hypothetical protein SAMN05421505_13436 [Sinosporangium album]|uniref:DUF5666 domain-containing protein n=1 Tax=Sinosporangium album TaxID=504805 RepID=A0A1G8HWJ0_9ACTN|nr:hypothetical protein [Sinosporangium album]SDI11003.1 hypothetical protein SAMN05421505_13436 [Sinosporangium album]
MNKDEMKVLETSPFAGDLDASLRARPRNGASKITLALGAGVVLVAGVLLGIQAQKNFGTTSSTAGPQLPAGPRQPGGGFSGGPGEMGRMGGGMTTGTITKIDGTKVHLETADGTEVVVTTDDQTTIQVTGKLADLKKGRAIVVQGRKSANGAVNATSIRTAGAVSR